MTAKIVQLRRSSLDLLNKRVKLNDIVWDLAAILRRRTNVCHDGQMVHVEFETEAEAKMFQSLVYAIKKRRKSRR